MLEKFAREIIGKTPPTAQEIRRTTRQLRGETSKAIINMDSPQWKKEHPEKPAPAEAEESKADVFEQVRARGFTLQQIQIYINAADENTTADLLEKTPSDFDWERLRTMHAYRIESNKVRREFHRSRI